MRPRLARGRPIAAESRRMGRHLARPRGSFRGWLHGLRVAVADLARKYNVSFARWRSGLRD